MVGNCSDNGIIGAVTGLIGSLQALETLQLVTGKQASLSGKLIVFDGTTTSFRTVSLRKKKEDCAICGENPSITKLIDYVAFCGAGPHDKALDLKVLPLEERMNVKEYHHLLTSNHPHVLLDVREEIQYEICSLESISNMNFVTNFLLDIPYAKLGRNLEYIIKEQEKKNQSDPSNVPVVVVCRLGNDSQLAVQALKKAGIIAKDIIGGYRQWSLQIDDNFPIY